jgi:hypothetical protein
MRGWRTSTRRRRRSSPTTSSSRQRAPAAWLARAYRWVRRRPYPARGPLLDDYIEQRWEVICL